MLAMIKINLLPARKPRRQSEPGQLDVAIGAGALLAAAAIVFFVVHRPMAEDRDKFKSEADALANDNNAKRAKIADLPQREAAFKAEQARNAAIKQLVNTIVVPDNVLHEIGEILTPSRLPTMTRAMAERVSQGPKGDQNRRLQLDWDPKHVWITSFSTKGDLFTLEGAAQSESDTSQLAKRMQASVYFSDVTSPTSSRFVDTVNSLTYYKFTISGKVVY
ncbi:MAG: PilN domain-containing protein [Kofleriaceae bacterium]|nr:MAG: PilN domain-containing protein [Kofleriaceae bacterium]MBZ0232148.1 PilN domain-containing protein [Kofleriaceae bacterium]